MKWPFWLALARLPVRRRDHGRRRLGDRELVLRKLVNQEGIILFMATLGLTFFLEGFGQTLWGSRHLSSSTSACPRSRCSSSKRCSTAASW